MDMQGLYDIFIGGAADDSSQIVQRYAAWYKGAVAPRDVAYFEWTDWDWSYNIDNYIKKIRKDHERYVPINIIGHSYGGDAAIEIAAAYGGLETLITIDPVGLNENPELGKGTSRTWINVYSNPDTWDFSDYVAHAGGHYGSDTTAYADYSYGLNAHHFDFDKMMETPLYNNSNNISPLDFLSAYSSSTRYGD